jgi:SPP1 gp7 family putative phage head morphogenesis protein
MTYEEAAKKAEKDGNRYRVRLLKQRAIRIARTEISAAANAGRYLSWIEAEDRGLLPAGSTKRWITATDERTCPICQPMNRVEIPWTIPFTTGDQMPPAHPNCRCTAVIVPAEAPVTKHLPGKHDQQSHSGGRAGKVVISPASNGNRKVSLGMYSADYKIGDMEATAQDGKDFMYRWEKNYEMRTASAHLMGIKNVKSAGKEDENLEHDYLETLVNPFGDDPEEFVYPKPIVQAIAGSSRLIDATHSAIPSEVNLFRGIKAERSSPLRNLREGQSFELPLSSFAQKSYYAEQFAGTSGERPNIRGASIIFNLKGVAKTYVLDAEESLTQGRFKVGKIDRVPNAAGSTTQVIELLQEATFDLETGTYVQVK